MNVELLSRPSNTAAKLTLAGGETVTTEGGAMIAMSDDMQVETSIRNREGGGLLKGMMRALGGERMFLNYYTAGSRGGELYLASPLPGDMESVELPAGSGITVQSGSFVAHESTVSMDVSWGGLKSAFGGERMIWLKLTGSGRVVINAFGAIYPVKVNGSYVVDTGNIAAFDSTLDFSIKKAGKSLIGSFAGGEGLVATFSGIGTVYCQTHADRVFGAKLTPHLTPKKQ
jgi:uncharacterized protein (TIGR00266 family)